MRIFQIGLICLLAVLQYKLWFGDNGLRDYWQMKENVANHQAEIDELLKRNKRLLADVEDLKIGLEGIEERARNELGLIKEGETFIRVLPTKK